MIDSSVRIFTRVPVLCCAADKQRYLEKERDSVVENEKAIDVNERQIGRLKEEAGAAERARTQFADELEALRRTVDRTAVELEAVRAQVAQLKKDAIEKHARLRQVQELRARLEERLKAETNSMLSAEERAKKLEQLLAVRSPLRTIRTCPVLCCTVVCSFCFCILCSTCATFCVGRTARGAAAEGDRAGAQVAA